MTNSRFYSSTAAVTSLQVTAGPSDATIQVASSSGFPGSFPYTLSLDYGAANEELVDVTGGGPSIFNVTRHVDGTSASTHNAGAVVRHVSSARDFTDSRTHEASNTGVHGISGSFVDTTSVQTISNKTLTAPIINNPTVANGTFTGTAAFTGTPNFSAGGTFAGSWSGAPTFSGSVSLSGGGALAGTFSGSPTFSGTPVFSGLTATSAAITTMTGNPNFSGTPTFGAATFSGAVAMSGGGSHAGTFSGSPTYSGNIAFTGVPTFTPITATDTSIIPDTVVNGWSLDSAAGRKAAGVTTIRVNVERAGSNIVASASGNIPDTKIGTLAAGWRPIDGVMITNYDMSGIATGSVSIGNDGIVTIKSLSAGNTIGLADTVNFSLTFVSST